MLKDISLGRYYETGSVLHKADPRIKIILYLIYLVAIFTVKSPVAVGTLFVITAFQTILAKIPPRIMKNSVVPVLPLTIFILILNIFTVRTGNKIFEYSFISITDDGLKQAILMSLRILFLIITTSVLLTLTTTPLKVSDALESLMKPLTFFHVPVQDFAMMMSIALRFIPTLIEETDKIMKAQVSRGADYDTGFFFKRVKGYVTVLIPLFISSFKRAEELAVAMDARCYSGIGRTKLNPLKIKGSDIVLFLINLALAVVLVLSDLIWKRFF